MADMTERRRPKRAAEDAKDPLRLAWGDVLQSYRRRKKGLTQRDLSLKASLPKGAVGALERGAREIKMEDLTSLCQALDVPVAVFVEDFKRAILEALLPLGERGGKKAGKKTQASADGRSFDAILTPGTDQDFDLYVMGVRFAGAGGDLNSFINFMRTMVKKRSLTDDEEPTS